MTAVTQAEVRAGLVVHLDTQVLRTAGNCQTNARSTSTSDVAVTGPHYFLVLSVSGGIATAVPLFSSYASGNVLLTESKKGGRADKWVGTDSYFSKWQHWRIPVATVVAASTSEESGTSDRRTYAASDPSALTAIEAWKDQNQEPWRQP